jgi:hypothetical protein
MCRISGILAGLFTRARGIEQGPGQRVLRKTMRRPR